METFLAIIFGRQDCNGRSRFLPIFACRGGPGSAARCGGGPRGTQKLIKQKFLMRVFCPHEPLRKYFRSVFSARTDHYENIFEAFSLPARTFTKTFSKRFCCPRGPLRNIFEAFFRPDYGESRGGNHRVYGLQVTRYGLITGR